MHAQWTTAEVAKKRERYRLNREGRMAAAREKGTHTALEWEILSNWSGNCVRCGDTEAPLTKDHIISIWNGGCDCIANIQPLCRPCNSSTRDDSEDLRNERWSAVLIDIMGRIFA